MRHSFKHYFFKILSDIDKGEIGLFLFASVSSSFFTPVWPSAGLGGLEKNIFGKRNQNEITLGSYR